ncbi:hypothetical protein CEXT_32691 [Caerostris extrusa]|uniref:Ycf1 n=1 Tax=Caerostris extrusa TaxID=172846 RepID=A0AAV4SM18_CAEEX|nr:hypothetical protein CEXT_32691 [Caerostris extrusa]
MILTRKDRFREKFYPKFWREITASKEISNYSSHPIRINKTLQLASTKKRRANHQPQQRDSEKTKLSHRFYGQNDMLRDLGPVENASGSSDIPVEHVFGDFKGNIKLFFPFHQNKQNIATCKNKKERANHQPQQFDSEKTKLSPRFHERNDMLRDLRPVENASRSSDISVEHVFREYENEMHQK